MLFPPIPFQYCQVSNSILKKHVCNIYFVSLSLIYHFITKFNWDTLQFQVKKKINLSNFLIMEFLIYSRFNILSNTWYLFLILKTYLNWKYLETSFPSNSLSCNITGNSKDVWIEEKLKNPITVQISLIRKMYKEWNITDCILYKHLNV